MDTIVVKAHGKINLSLDVLGRRVDGYHELRSVMQSIALADTIVISKADQISVATNIDFVLPQENLAYKAALLFLQASHIHTGVHIHVEKHLPIAAGLAGGSADAAAVLWALNQLFATDYTVAQLQKMGKQLGADVPFCLQGGTLLAEGIGDRLTQLPEVNLKNIVLIKPQPSLSTKHVYAAVQPSMYGERYTAKLVQALTQGQDITAYFGNALEAVSVSLLPEIAVWCQRLLDNQAQTAFMSGSGPTVVGIFKTREQAEEFVQKWQHACWMTITETWPTGITLVKE